VRGRLRPYRLRQAARGFHRLSAPPDDKIYFQLPGLCVDFSIASSPEDPVQFTAAVRQFVGNPDVLHKMEEAATTTKLEYERTKELEKLVAVLEDSAR
jgi:hypothetical protein